MFVTEDHGSPRLLSTTDTQLSAPTKLMRIEADEADPSFENLEHDNEKPHKIGFIRLINFLILKYKSPINVK